MAEQPTSMTITLAHPLSERDAADVYADRVRDYQPGEKITVPSAQVMRLVNAGLVKGVSPDDSQAIRNLFMPEPQKTPDGDPAAAGSPSGEAAGEGGAAKKTSARK